MKGQRRKMNWLRSSLYSPRRRALLCSPRCRHTRELGALTCTPHDSHSPGRLPRRSRPSSSPTSTLCPLCSMRTMTGPRSHPCICRSIYRATVSWTTLWAARGRAIVGRRSSDSTWPCARRLAPAPPRRGRPRAPQTCRTRSSPPHRGRTPAYAADSLARLRDRYGLP